MTDWTMMIDGCGRWHWARAWWAFLMSRDAQCEMCCRAALLVMIQVQTNDGVHFSSCPGG